MTLYLICISLVSGPAITIYIRLSVLINELIIKSFPLTCKTTDTSPIVTDLSAPNRLQDRKGMQLVPGSQEQRVGAIDHVHYVVLAIVLFDVHKLVAF